MPVANGKGPGPRSDSAEATHRLNSLAPVNVRPVPFAGQALGDQDTSNRHALRRDQPEKPPEFIGVSGVISAEFEDAGIEQFEKPVRRFEPDPRFCSAFGQRNLGRINVRNTDRLVPNVKGVAIDDAVEVRRVHAEPECLFDKERLVIVLRVAGQSDDANARDNHNERPKP